MKVGQIRTAELAGGKEEFVPQAPDSFRAVRPRLLTRRRGKLAKKLAEFVYSIWGPEQQLGSGRA